jgi:thiol-disulfide isomerase/thioredoxin
MIILWPFVGTAQEIKPLIIGDQTPDIEVNNIYNYSSPSLHLNQLKGKLVILDFWATWCSSCIKEFPKMQDLQKQFSNQVQILMIDTDSSETEKHVNNFLTRRKDRTGEAFTLPYALHNYEVGQYFPHREIPHYIWINRSGRVVGITNAEDVTAKNVEAFLNDTSYTLLTKRDYLRFNPQKPLLVDENGGDDPTGFLYRSIITGFKENLGAEIGNRLAPNGGVIRFYALNCNLLALLGMAYHSVFEGCGLDRIIVESKKYSRSYFTDISLGMLPENRYCYEIITPPVPQAEITKYMQQDIYRNFKIGAKKEMRVMNCYVLQTNSSVAKIRTKGGEPGVDVEKNTLHKYLRNESTSELVNQVIQSHFSIPVIDETHLGYNIDLSFPFNFHDYTSEEIIKYLHEHGLELTHTKRNLEAIVISDQIN